MVDPDDMIADDVVDLVDQIAYEDHAGLPWDPMDDECDEQDQFLSDAEADENAMTSAGHGEDESFGYYGVEED